ncbi:sugar ABC transporter ATP-binding protein [Rothia sp. ZJ932]|uniref:sugar ABC transporter ATP-binding protein n=1 Tax=Rothia sp. ZJ932 TaxID=2810516 RepID=UPI001966E87C|nr:sugar ABC transporter ATP-binding protein [Rothia sp. ZJ932]QRZ61351.1 sugar ABC transporter ATP-binding protein [Rothia sp. ZJ932]
MDNLLSIKGLTKSHGHTRALRGVDLDIARGEVVGLLGENGAGKSTLISILGGYDTPDGGTMSIAGEGYVASTSDEAMAVGIGSIRQKFSIDPELTVAQAIFRASFHANKPADEQRERALELLGRVNLEIDPDAKMGDLVRAEQALIEVVRMQAEETQLVLMDEVAATFNDYEIFQLHEITRRLIKEGRSVIYITHRIDELRSLADRIAILRDGVVATEFDPRDLGPEEIVYKMLERNIVMGTRPEEYEGEDVRLEVENLSSEDGSLKDVSFSVGRGEIFGLTGIRRSGMNEVAGALVGVKSDVTYSKLQMDGEAIKLDSAEDAVKQGIGYLSDNDDELGIANERSIAKTLMGGDVDEAGFVHEVSALRDVVNQVQKLRIKTTNIQGEVGNLSGGDQQKVALARWMTTDCDLLILNHPTRGIDVGARSDIYQMLKDLALKGTSIIIIGSEMGELVELCNRIAVMRDGSLVSIQRNKEADEDTLMEDVLGDDF